MPGTVVPSSTVQFVQEEAANTNTTMKNSRNPQMIKTSIYAYSGTGQAINTATVTDECINNAHRVS